MSSGGGTTQTIQQSDPWAGAQPHLSDIFQRAHGQSFESTLGAQSPYTLQAQQMQAQRGMAGSPLTDAAQQQNLKTINGDYTDLSKNPAAQNAMDMARSQINGQFSGDNYGNSAHQEWLNRGLMSAASPYYEGERNRQQQAIGMAPGLASQDYMDIGQLGAAGAGQDARSQQVAEDPWQSLFNYQKAISGAGGGTSTSQQPYYQNNAANLAGLGLGAYGLANSGLGAWLGDAAVGLMMA